MKIRGLVIAALVFFALAGLLYWSDHRKPSEDTAKASTDTPPAILKLDSANITKLDLKKKDAEPLRLARQQSGKWQITEPKSFAADQDTVSTMLSTLSSLNSERLVEEKAPDLKPYGLDQPAVEVDVTDKSNKTQKLLIGDDTPTGAAVYAMLVGDPRVFTMATYSKNSVDKGLNDLRDKRLLTVNADKISRVELTRKNQVLEFGRNKEDWQLLKPKPLRADSSAVGELVRKLTDAKMDLSSDDSKAAAAGFAKAAPLATAKLTDESGTQELQVRKNVAGKDKDTYYAKSTGAEGAYKVNADLGQALDKGLDDFRNKKLFDFGYGDPNKLEIHSGSKAYYLMRNGEDWWSNGKKMDADSAQSLVSKLRDLSADKFPDSGFANPTMEAVVTSDDGKRIEKIQIAKSADGYIAKRENEPAFYHLTAASIDDLQKAADDLKQAAAPEKTKK
jgi:Domain of unknown function (DUF4340)